MNGSPKKPSFIRHFRKSVGIIPLAAILLASTFTAGRADAGVLSLFTTVSGKSQTENAPTIQKMRILEVVFSPAFTGQGGEDVITDESALISNDTPIIDPGLPVGGSFAVESDENADVPVDHEGEATIRTYTVKSGDTISGIAEKNGVSINTIVWANNLDRKQTLKIGEVLTILPVSGIQYTVRRGDTIDSIAKKYGAETNDIKEFNDITNASLVAGVKIIVPGAELSASTPAPVVADTVKTVVASAATKVAAKVASSTFAVDENVKPETSVSENSTSEKSATAEDADDLVYGTLVRPKINNGDSSDFIRPLTDGVGVKSQGKHDTWAVDLAAKIGTPIHAAQKGTVILVKSTGYNGGYGKYVAIEHEGGVQTLYAHMSETKVSVGQVVAQGEVIGLVGSTGRSTGPHVHYEVRGAPNNCFAVCE